MRCSHYHSPVRILTYPFTYTYKITHLLLDASHGHRMILYYCRLLNSLSRCGIPRFAEPHYDPELRGLSTSSVDWYLHPNNRGPHRNYLSTCVGTRWIWVHFRFTRSKDQLMGKTVPSRSLQPYCMNCLCARLFRNPTASSVIPGVSLPLG